MFGLLKSLDYTFPSVNQFVFKPILEAVRKEQASCCSNFPLKPDLCYSSPPQVLPPREQTTNGRDTLQLHYFIPSNQA
jgi:hypothetical protein